MSGVPSCASEHEQRVSALFCEVAELTAEARRAAIERVRAESPSVAAEVESLLGFHDGQDAILDRSPMVEFDDKSTEASGPPTIGSSIAGWTLQAPLGAGGTFVNYRATRERDGLIGVFKVVRPELLSLAMVERFERAAGLAWPRDAGIAEHHGAGVERRGGASAAYAAVELVEGTPINEYARNNRLAPTERLALAATMCEAMGAGHQQGVPHTALKPSNVLVIAPTDQPRVKVMGFGLSRLIEAPVLARSSGSAVLTPGRSRIRSLSAYAAPEQVGDTAALPDARTDVYALGAIVFEMFTGRAPDRGAATSTGHSADLPPEVATVVQAAMSAEREARFADGVRMAEALRACSTETPRETRSWLGRLLGR